MGLVFVAANSFHGTSQALVQKVELSKKQLMTQINKQNLKNSDGMSQFSRVNKYKVNIVLLVCLTLLLMSVIVFQGRRPQTQIVTLAAPTAVFKIRPADVQQIKQNDLNVKGYVSGN